MMMMLMVVGQGLGLGCLYQLNYALAAGEMQHTILISDSMMVYRLDEPLIVHIFRST